MAICGRGVYEVPAYSDIKNKYPRVWKYVLIKTKNGRPLIEVYNARNKFGQHKEERWKITLMLKVLVSDEGEIIAIILARDEGVRARTFSIWGINEEFVIGTVWGELFIMHDYSENSDNKRLIMKNLKNCDELIFPIKPVKYADAELLCRGIFIPTITINNDEITIEAHTSGFGELLRKSLNSTHVVKVWRREIRRDFRKTLNQLPITKRRKLLRSQDIFYNGITDNNGKIVRPGFKHLVKTYVKDLSTHYRFSELIIRYQNGAIRSGKIPSIFQTLFFANQLVKYKVDNNEGSAKYILLFKTCDNVAVSTSIRNLIITSEKYQKYLFHMKSWADQSIFSLLKLNLKQLLAILQKILKDINEHEDLKYAINKSLEVKYRRKIRKIEDIDFRFWVNVNQRIKSAFQALLALFSIHRRYYGAIFESIKVIQRTGKIHDLETLREGINRIIMAWQYDVNLLIMILRDIIQKIISDKPNRIIIDRLEVIVSFPLHYTLVQKDLRKLSNVRENALWRRIIDKFEQEMQNAEISKPKITPFLIKIWLYFKSSERIPFTHPYPSMMNTLSEPDTLDNIWRQTLPKQFRRSRKYIFQRVLDLNTDYIGISETRKKQD